MSAVDGWKDISVGSKSIRSFHRLLLMLFGVAMVEDLNLYPFG